MPSVADPLYGRINIPNLKDQAAHGCSPVKVLLPRSLGTGTKERVTSIIVTLM